MIAMPCNEVLLALTERGRGQHPIDRALTILEAFTGRDRLALAKLSLAQRDALLIAARTMMFGPQLSCALPCSACGEAIELVIRFDEPVPFDERGDATVVYKGRTYAIRAPDSFDAAAILTCADVRVARTALALRCIGADVADDTLVDAIDAALGQACAFATIDCRVACPACGAGIDAPLCVESVLWTELDWHAERLIDDIVVLAARFGWGEAEVLALPESRREHYVRAAG